MDTDREPDLQGQLNHILLIDILQMLSLSGQTGTLELRQGWNTRGIFFQEGRLTFISQGARPLSLGELLVKSGQITQQQFDFLAQRSRQTGLSFTRQLLDSGLVAQEDLHATNDQQIEEAIYSLFLWRDCAFRFYHGDPEKLDLGDLVIGEQWIQRWSDGVDPQQVERVEHAVRDGGGVGVLGVGDVNALRTGESGGRP